MSFVRAEYRNAILALLNNDELGLLKPHLERVAIKGRDVLEAPDLPIQYVYFIEEGMASVVAKMLRGRDRDIEVALIGREGMSGCALVQGDDRSPHHTSVQFDGTAMRIGAADFHDALLKSPSMQAKLNLYVRALGIQVVATALAIGRFRLEQRLARWLVMAQDRLGGDRVALTHEAMGEILGVRRPGVTVALHVLEGRGLIRSNRAEIIIIDRDGLIGHADGAYGLPEREYDRLLQKDRPQVAVV
ncbi:MAG TPA: Crp/Fnr family transcriptional regulator [Arsenicitalea sp.]|jgi:CRP-like cAMP-binding protein|nr:Crp/Fnr family transcriptional regulator [Arsenicitalea sp.]